MQICCMLYYIDLSQLKHENNVNNPFYIRLDANKTNMYERELQDKCMYTNSNTAKTQITKTTKLNMTRSCCLISQNFHVFF